VVFKRRDSRPISRLMIEAVWPPSGWKRAGRYILIRLRRLPDTPERIARGFALGVFMAFTPLFGLHFIGAALLAMAFRANVIASLLGTFAGNPLTTPVFATMSLETGYWLMGSQHRMTLPSVMARTAEAAGQIARNLVNFLYGIDSNWDQLNFFFAEVFVPYLLGSIIPGVFCAVAVHFSTLPLIRAWQRMRASRTAERIARRKALRRQIGNDNAPPPRPPLAAARPGKDHLPPPSRP